VVTELYAENLVDAVTDDDRAWFELQPSAPWRFRPFAPGEFAPVPGSEYEIICQCGPPVATVVLPAGPDARWRQFVFAHHRRRSQLTCAGLDVARVLPRA